MMPVPPERVDRLVKQAIGSRFAHSLSRLRSVLVFAATNPIAPVVTLGLVVRLALAPFTSWTWDLLPSYLAGMDMLSGASPYHSMFYSYPPAWAYTFAPMVYLLSAIVPPGAMGTFVPALIPVSQLTQLVSPLVTSPPFNLAVKSPLIAADLATGLLLFRMVRDMSGPLAAKRAFSTWFLNPLVILSGSVNGQFDVLPSMFVLFSIYFLYKHEAFFAGAALALSMAYKLYAIYLLPIYVFPLLSVTFRGPRTSWTRAPIMRFTAGVLAVTALFAFFFPWDSGVTAIFRRVDIPSYGGFTPLLLLSNWNLTGYASIVFVASVVGTLAGMMWLGWRSLRPSPAVSDTFTLPELAAMNVVGLIVVYTFSTLVNPQYLLWILPGMILLAFHDHSSPWFVRSASLLGCGLTIALAGPLVFFYPLSIWTGTPSTSLINDSVTVYWGLPGPFRSPLWHYAVSVISWVGYLILIVRAKSAWAVVRGKGHA